jgi:hypothetical protein
MRQDRPESHADAEIDDIPLSITIDSHPRVELPLVFDAARAASALAFQFD